ncbi:prephenate dehydrogenase [Shewanella profunda]|uniref:prephenate dehydrogenase n=1 Tax=Shewanella profunda TaxID=254793 RepID=UPI00200FD37D|nr:prephenate dehydrogenase [Shewanella profunda]MCL1089182.1 prephenate dehydrogenase [Shewanella profunda]
MPHTKVIEQLKENLQTAYRQAIDADAKLDELKKAGHGKFTSIFTLDQGFIISSNRFLPYVQELVDDLTTLESQPTLDPVALETYVRQLGILLKTLQVFKKQS